eukprot:4528139-Ditylum_brightwellii.AAC.1
MLATSLPAYGSVIAKQMNFSPRKQGPEMRSFISSLPKCNTGGKPMPRPPNKPQHTPPEPQRANSSTMINT